MKFSIKISGLIVLLLVFAHSAAHAQTVTNQFCFHWQAYWSDIYIGYDYLDNPTTANGWTIPDIPIKVEIGNLSFSPDGTEQWTSEEIRPRVLDSNGCIEVEDPHPMPHPSSPAYRHIRFQIPLQISQTDPTITFPARTRAVRILSNDSSNKVWTSGIDGNIAVESVQADVSITNAQTTTQDITIPNSPQSRAFLLIHRFMQNSDLFNFPYDAEILIAHSQDQSSLDAADYYPGCEGRDDKKNIVSNIGLTGKSIGNALKPYSGSPVARICMGRGTYNRRTVLHEIGHALNRLNGASLLGDYKADEPEAAMSSEKRCKQGTIKYVDLSGNATWEPLRQTWGREAREWVGTAAEEGFADFIAYAARMDRNLHTSLKPFNGRSDPFYDTVKDMWSDTDPSTNYDLSPHNVYSGDPERYWTKRFCAPPDEFPNLGSPRDWSRFHWGLWAADDDLVQFEISELHDIWRRIESRTVWCTPFQTIHDEEWTCRFWVGPIVEYKHGPFATIPVYHWPQDFRMGRRYVDMKEVADETYNTPGSKYNPEKFRYFERTARAAGVEY